MNKENAAAGVHASTLRRREPRPITSSIVKMAVNATTLGAMNIRRFETSLLGVNTADRAVVVTLTVAVAGVVPLNVTDAGETVQAASAGAPLQVRATFPINPAPPVNDRGYVAVAPAATVAIVPEPPGTVTTVKSTPVPRSATVCGRSVLGSTVRVPMRLSPVVGEKVTDI
jgi:hypothetical protein